MRFVQFINNVIRDVLKNEQSYQKMRIFSHDSFKDGWEIWLQCEAISVLPESRQYIYSRGDPYPAPYANKKCDFLLKRDDMRLWLELKVLLKDNGISLIERFADDLNKIADIKIPDDKNSVGAFCVIPLNGASIFSKQVKDRFREKTKVDMGKIQFVAAKPGVNDITGNYNSNPTIDNDRIVMLYFVEV